MNKRLLLIILSIFLFTRTISPMESVGSRKVEDSIGVQTQGNILGRFSERIDELGLSQESESKEILKKLATLFFYQESLLEVFNAGRLAAMENSDYYFDDLGRFYSIQNELSQSISNLLETLDVREIGLIKDLETKCLFGLLDFDFLKSVSHLQNRFEKDATNFICHTRSLIDLLKSLIEDYRGQQDFTRIRSQLIKALRVFQSSYKTQKIGPSILDYKRGNINHLQERFSKIDRIHSSLKNIFKIPESNICSSCGQHAEKICTRCKQIYYCGTTCQKAHWKRHRRNCKIFKKVNPIFEELDLLIGLKDALLVSFDQSHIDYRLKNKFNILKKFPDFYVKSSFFKNTASLLYKQIMQYLNHDLGIEAGLFKGRSLPTEIYVIHEIYNSKNRNDIELAYKIIEDMKHGIRFEGAGETEGTEIGVFNRLIERKKTSLRMLDQNESRHSLVEFLNLSCLPFEDLVGLGYLDEFEGEEGEDEGEGEDEESIVLIEPFSVGKQFVLPRSVLTPMVVYYEQLIDRARRRLEIAERQKQRDLQLARSKRRRKRVRDTKINDDLISDSSQENESDSPYSPYLLLDEEDERSDSPGLLPDEEEGQEGVRVVRRRRKKKRTIRIDFNSSIARYFFDFINDLYYMTTGDCVYIRKEFDEGQSANGVVSVLYPENKHKFSDLDMDLHRVNPELYRSQDHFHNFSKVVDQYVNLGYGRVVRSFEDLPECCRSESGRELFESSRRFAVVIKGQLCTNTGYFERIRSVKRVDRDDVRSGLHHGYYMYVFSKNRDTQEDVLIHRCFHEEHY